MAVPPYRPLGGLEGIEISEPPFCDGVADLLVERKWAIYRDNPARRRAKLLEPTSDGRRALGRLAVAQHASARRLFDR